MKLARTTLCSLIATALVGLATAQTQPKRTPDVVYLPTTDAAVDAMLTLADVKKTDVVYDLGCGDGRIVITAAKKYGARGVGIDIDPKRYRGGEREREKGRSGAPGPV